MRCSPFFLLLLVSCSATLSTKEVVVEQEVLHEIGFRKAETVFALSEDATSVYVTQCGICVFNREGSSEHFLKLLSMGSEDSRWYVSHGYAEDQLLLPILSFGGQDALLYDAVLNKACKIDVCAALADNQYECLYHSTNIISQRVVPVGDRLLYLNPNSYDGKEPRLLWSDAQWNAVKVRNKTSHDKNYLNVLSGNIVYREGNSIAFVSRHSPEIEIFDWTGGLECRLVFPHQQSSTIEVINAAGQRETVFTSVETCFVCAFAYGDYFATCFRDDSGQDYVLVLDWQGEIVDGFKPEGTVKTISLGREGVFVFENDGDTRTLKKYSICVG